MDDTDDDMADDMDDNMADGGATVIVTDSAGHTLYIWDSDGPGVSNCNEGCADIWPPLTVDGDATAGDGVDGVVATISRGDGSMQATYNDQPLYYFATDEAPGGRAGVGVGGTWHIVAAGGKRPLGGQERRRHAQAGRLRLRANPRQSCGPTQARWLATWVVRKR